MKKNNVWVLLGLLFLLIGGCCLLFIALSSWYAAKSSQQIAEKTVPSPRNEPAASPTTIINEDLLHRQVKPYISGEINPQQWEEIDTAAKRAAETTAIRTAVAQQFTQPLSDEEMEQKIADLFREVFPENTSRQLGKLYASSGPSITRIEYAKVAARNAPPEANINQERVDELCVLVSELLYRNRELHFQQKIAEHPFPENQAY